MAFTQLPESNWVNPGKSLRVVRIASLVIATGFFVWGCYVTFDRRYLPEPADFLKLLVFIPLWLPFAWIFWRLRGPIKPEDRKWTLSLACCLGLGFSLIFGYLVFGEAMTERRILFLLFVGIVIFGPALCVTSFRLFGPTRKRFADWAILMIQIPLFPILICVSLTCAPLFFPRRESNDPAAIGAIRVITTSQFEYESTHPQSGFAPSLAELGPPPGENQIDGALASGTKSGYLFTMTASDPGKIGKNTAFTVSAVPLKFGKFDQYSFFSDESGVIHYTRENRPANASDPKLE